MHFRCWRQKYLEVVCIDPFGNVALANLNLKMHPQRERLAANLANSDFSLKLRFFIIQIFV